MCLYSQIATYRVLQCVPWSIYGVMLAVSTHSGIARAWKILAAAIRRKRVGKSRRWSEVKEQKRRKKKWKKVEGSSERQEGYSPSTLSHFLSNPLDASCFYRGQKNPEKYQVTESLHHLMESPANFHWSSINSFLYTAWFFAMCRFFSFSRKKNAYRQVGVYVYTPYPR